MDISKSLLFLTQSSTPSPNPANHYGYLYASGSTLWWKNNQGQEFDLGLSSGSISIFYYTGSVSGTQTYTWTRSPRLKYMTVICVGAGGGGGSGKIQGSNTNNVARGGLGGGGGAIVYSRFQKSDLPLTATITAGAGGIGGSAVTLSPPTSATTNIVGVNGSNGESTSFGSLVIAGGGEGGSAGANQLVTAVQGGKGGGNHNSIPSYGLYCIPGCYGGYGASGGSPFGNDASVIGGSILNALSPVVIGSGVSTGIITGGGSGGGGGGCVQAVVPPVYSIAGSGSGVLTRTGTFGSGNPGSAGSGNPGSNGGDNIGKDLILQFGKIVNTGILTIDFITSSYGIGGGGGGGGTSAADTNAGNGGSGGLYGAGGGGGGGAKRTLSTTTVSSGAGGNGSPGLCILIEYY